MNNLAPTEAQWPYVLTMLPQNYEETARTMGAFQRRRAVDSPATLLRLALSYAADDSSLRLVAGQVSVQGIATLSDVALLKRLRAAAAWMGRLLTDLLAQEVSLPAASPHALRLRLQDATTVSQPGSKGTDWRIHLGLNLQTLTMDQVEVTDAQGGETLQRVQVSPGEVWVVDRGYAQRAGIASCVEAGGHVVVRLNWQNVPLQHPEGQPFDLLGALRALPDATYGEFPVQTAPDAKRQVPAVRGRLVAVRKSPAQAEAARRKVVKEARKKGKTPAPETLEAAGYLFLFTTLPAAWFSAEAVLGLYRFRWQVELTFKRLKSLLSLEELTAKDPQLCQAFLFGKLLLFTLSERLSRPPRAFSPWGYGTPRPGRGHPGVAAHPGRLQNAPTSDRPSLNAPPMGNPAPAIQPPPGRETAKADPTGDTRPQPKVPSHPAQHKCLS